MSLLAKIKPTFDKQEKSRRSKLTGPELYKEKGDDQYKNAQFEAAIAEYTKCLDALAKKNALGSPLAVKTYSNRAACYKQISNFDGTISDCTAVLEVEPDNVKALIRRAQAFEGVERYRFALQDVKVSCCFILLIIYYYHHFRSSDGMYIWLISHSFSFFAKQQQTVLQMPFSQVGKANFDLCNGMQHRLQRTVTQLKKMDSA